MRFLLRSILVAVLAVVFPTWLGAQRYNFKYYAHGDGLGDMEVHSLLQDRTGFIWIGTASGLYRYDGRHFRGYSQPEGLPDGSIESLHETADGTLLVGTQKGIARREGERFQAVPIPGTPAISSRSSLDSDRQGRVYAATDQGLFVGRTAFPGMIFIDIRIRRKRAVLPPTVFTSIRTTRCGSAVAAPCAPFRKID